MWHWRPSVAWGAGRRFAKKPECPDGGDGVLGQVGEAGGGKLGSGGSVGAEFGFPLDKAGIGGRDLAASGKRGDQSLQVLSGRGSCRCGFGAATGSRAWGGLPTGGPNGQRLRRHERGTRRRLPRWNRRQSLPGLAVAMRMPRGVGRRRTASACLVSATRVSLSSAERL